MCATVFHDRISMGNALPSLGPAILNTLSPYLMHRVFGTLSLLVLRRSYLEDVWMISPMT